MGLHVAVLEAKAGNAKRGWASIDDTNAGASNSSASINRTTDDGGTIEADEDEEELAQEAEAAVAAFEKQVRNPSNVALGLVNDDD